MDALFLLKKTITALLMPLPLFLLLGTFGVIILWGSWRPAAQRLGRVMVSLALLGIALAAFYPLSAKLMRPYESAYPAYPALAAMLKPEAIMVLGHSHVDAPERPMAARLSSEALSRLVEGIRIWQMSPESWFIVSGYDGGTPLAHATLMATVAEQLGVNPEKIVQFTQPQDTQAEAEYVSAFLDTEDYDNFVLVSSASHLPRAMQIFAQHSLFPTPAPAYYLTPEQIHQPWDYWPPKAQYLYITERFWHEWLGKTAEKLKHWWQHDENSQQISSDAERQD